MASIIRQVLQLDDKATPKVKQASGEAERLDKAFGMADMSLAKMGLGLAAAATAVVAFAQKMADLHNLLNDTARRTGIAAETLAGLRLAAQGSGLELENLTSGLQQFPKRMDDFSRGVGEAAVAFESLGFKMEDMVGPSGQLRSADAVFRETVSRLGDLTSETQQAAAASQLFGRSGTQLLQALGDPKALEDFAQHAKNLGIDLEAGAESAGKWQRAVADLTTSLEGAGDKIGRSLGMEGLTGIVDLLTDAIVFLSSFASGVFDQLALNMVNMGDGLVGIKQTLVDLVSGKDLDVVKASFRAAVSSFDNVSGGFGTWGAIATDASDAVFAGQRTRAATRAAAAVASPEEEKKRQRQQSIAADPTSAIVTGGQGAGISISAAQTVSMVPTAANVGPGLAAQRAEQLARTQLGLGAGAGLLSGNLAPGLAALGPVGAAVGGLSQIGELGAEGVRANLDAFTDSLIEGLRALPEILGEVIPDFVSSLVTTLIPELVAALPDIIFMSLVGLPEAIAQALAEVIGVGGSLKIGGQEVTTFGQGWTAGRAGAAVATGGLSELYRGAKHHLGFQTGGVADYTGMHFLHEGERIQPATGAGNQTTATGMSGGAMGGTVIDLRGAFVGSNAADEIARLIDERFGMFGTGQSAVLGGVR